MPSPAPTFRCVFVVGHAHCGSTLLGRLLNRHPAMLCVGEMLRVQDALEDAYPCSCGAVLDQCPFWQSRLGLIAEAARKDYRKTKLPDYENVLVHEPQSVLIDTSKTRVHRLRRSLFRADDCAIIWMIRDPRGVMASHLRRGNPLSDRLSTHAKWTRRFARMEKGMRDRVQRVHYEDMVAQPEQTLHQLCAFIGVPFDRAMLSDQSDEHHLIHASVTTTMPRLADLKCDERWRDELTPDQLRKIERFMAKWQFLRERYLRG